MGQLNRLLKIVALEPISCIQEGVTTYLPRYRLLLPQLQSLSSCPSNWCSPHWEQHKIHPKHCFLLWCYVSSAGSTVRKRKRTQRRIIYNSLCKRHHVKLQWIPAHCRVQGNEETDSLVKGGSMQEQVDMTTTLREIKTAIKTKQHSKWLQQHPQHNKKDPYTCRHGKNKRQSPVSEPAAWATIFSTNFASESRLFAPSDLPARQQNIYCRF